MAGRRCKLTPEVHETIVKAMRHGNYLQDAAAYAGVNKTTVYRWLERGRNETERLDADDNAKPDKAETPFREFCTAVAQAEAECLVTVVAAWRNAALTDHRAAKEWAARRHGDRWGDKARVEHSGPEGAPITLQGLAGLMGINDEAE